MTTKLRAWDNSQEIMHYGFEYISSGDAGNDWIIFKSDRQTLENAEVLDNPYSRQQFNIMESVPITDSKETLIFTEDIVQLIEGGEIGTVKKGLTSVTSDDNYCTGEGIGYYIEFPNGEKEILGNPNYDWGRNPTISSNLLVIGNTCQTKD